MNADQLLEMFRPGIENKLDYPIEEILPLVFQEENGKYVIILVVSADKDSGIYVLGLDTNVMGVSLWRVRGQFEKFQDSMLFPFYTPGMN